MTPYLFTITFLMMITCLTSSEALHYSKGAVEKSCYLSSRQALVAQEELLCLCDLEEIRGEQNIDPQKRPVPKEKKAPKSQVKRYPELNINMARPPNNSRLNFFALFHGEPHKNVPQEFSIYEAMAQLMRQLYHNAPFFQKIPQVEYYLLDQLIDKKEECTQFSCPDDLATLTFDDPKLQEIFYQMLKGTRESRSLLYYVTFDTTDSARSQTRKINLLFADPLILKALFPKGDVAEKLILRRDQIWQEILNQEEKRAKDDSVKYKGRRDFAQDLSVLLEEVLTAGGLDYKKYKSQVFDCTLGKSGSVIFHEDLETGELIRKKYTPPKKKTNKGGI